MKKKYIFCELLREFVAKCVKFSETRTQSLDIPHGICDGRSGIGTNFVFSFSFFPVMHTLINHPAKYSRPICCRSTSELSLTPRAESC